MRHTKKFNYARGLFIEQFSIDLKILQTESRGKSFVIRNHKIHESGNKSIVERLKKNCIKKVFLIGVKGNFYNFLINF